MPPKTLSVDIKGDVKIAIRKKDSSTRQIMAYEDVRVLAQYKVDEYDILILSAEQGRSLYRWLRDKGYTMPAGAAPVLQSYIRQGMYFFVAKVNLTEQARLGFTSLRPIQVAYESPKFMLPLRLGMVNAQGDQEMFVYTLTRTGRVEATNYRTVRMPTDLEIPEFVRPDFPGFYASSSRDSTSATAGTPFSSSTPGTSCRTSLRAIPARRLIYVPTSCAPWARSGSRPTLPIRARPC